MIFFCFLVWKTHVGLFDKAVISMVSVLVFYSRLIVSIVLQLLSIELPWKF